MTFCRFANALVWALGLSLAAANLSPANVVLRTRNLPGTSDRDTLRAVGRALRAARRDQDQTYSGQTTLQMSWDSATLYQNEDRTVAIICKTCYIQTNVSATLTIASSENVTTVVDNVLGQVRGDIQNFTDDALTAMESFFKEVADDLVHPSRLATLSPPTLNTSNVNLDFDDAIPNSEVQIVFDGLEIYAEIDTVLSDSKSWALTLFNSGDPKTAAALVAAGVPAFGFSADGIDVGIILKIDLLMNLDGDIDISSGLHIKLNDGFAINIGMFANNVSSITHSGGQFEFLPVSVVSATVTFDAIVRVSVSVGVDLADPTSDLPSTMTDLLEDADVDVSAALEMVVFTDVAHFFANITADPSDSACEILVEEQYTFAIGAGVAATLGLTIGSTDAHTWGPAPTSTIPIFYTTLLSICASSKTSTSTVTATTTAAAKRAALPGAPLEPRATSSAPGALSPYTLTQSVNFTATSCLVSNSASCPLPAQTTIVVASVSTIITSVSSGLTPTWPATVISSVSAIPFGTNVKQMTSSSGAPTSFVPTATSGVAGAVASAKNWLEEDTNGVPNKTILGVVVGLGVPVLAALITGLVCCCRRRKYAPVATGQSMPMPVPVPMPMVSEPYKSGGVTINVHSQ